MTRHAIALLLLAGLLSGCATRHMLGVPFADLGKAGLINDPEQVSRLEKSITDGEIAKLLDLDVRAKLPTSLAVAKLRSECPAYQPHLVRIDADEMQTWEKIASKHKRVLGVQPVSNLSMGNSLGEPRLTLRSLRVAAARLHCELLLVYMQGDSAVDNFNDAAVLYWSVVGLWLVPGNELAHKTVMQAILVDCRTGIILGTATGSSHKKRLSPAAFADIHEEQLAGAAGVEALAGLHEGTDELLGQVISQAVAKR